MNVSEKIEYKRKSKDGPVVAICYDFDKTLSPDNMQAQGYIQSVGWDIEEFWRASNALAAENDMDENLAYMLKMVREAEGNIVLNRKSLRDYGAKIGLYDGVTEWFGRIRDYGAAHGVTVEHYIISSGLKEMIEGTAVAAEFERIYASSFYFNERGVAVWPAQVVNYTNKTQFLFRIEKGVLDINDPGVNEYFPPERVRVPFRNMIYIGDSDTDVPCMKLVGVNGGHSIGVYNPRTRDKTKVFKMLRDGRIGYFAPADYSEGSELDRIVKSIIDRTAANEKLEGLRYACKHETDNAAKTDKAARRRAELIAALDDSTNFATTHTVIAELNKCEGFGETEADALVAVALNNSQVRSILRDSDVRRFFFKTFEREQAKRRQFRRAARFIEVASHFPVRREPRRIRNGQEN